MARIRTIKPDAWQDGRLARVSRDARLLWAILITMADDAGRFRTSKAIIFGHGYPEDEDALALIPAWLDELSSAGLVDLYEASGERFGFFPKWAEHQRISRPTPSRLPDPHGIPEGSRGIPGKTSPEEEGERKGKSIVEPDRLDAARVVSELFAYWQQRCGHGHAKLTNDRRAKIKARLTEGYTVEQIRQAIDGAATNAFVDDKGKRFDDIELICRNGSKLESFIDRAATATSGSSAEMVRRIGARA